LCIIVPTKKLVHLRDFPKDTIVNKVLTKYAVIASKLVIVNSSFMQISLQKYGIDKIRVIPNGILVTSISHNHDKKSHNTSFNILMIANYAPWKMHLFAIEVLRILSNSIPVHMTIVGDDIFDENKSYKQSIEEKAKAIYNIDMVGWSFDVSKHFANAHMLFHPAKNEPYGRCIIEAIEHEVPVLCHSNGGPSEIIHQGEFGHVFKKYNEKEVSNQIHQIYSNYEEAKVKAIKAKSFYSKNTYDTIVTSYKEILFQ